MTPTSQRPKRPRIRNKLRPKALIHGFPVAKLTPKQILEFRRGIRAPATKKKPLKVPR